MYSCAPYATASGFVELPYLFLQSAVFVPISYWMIGFEANAAKFFFFWLVFLMALTLNTFLGQLLVIVTPNQQLGQLLGSGSCADLLLLLIGIWRARHVLLHHAVLGQLHILVQCKLSICLLPGGMSPCANLVLVELLVAGMA